MVKKGDTLIEVTLAIGIFSMVAIAIAAVLSGSTAGAQTSLETTLTREEIDAQAESLRYIHTAYAVNKNDTETNHFAGLWQKITENAIDLNSASSDSSTILEYAPSSCADLYNEDYVQKYGFVINPRALGLLTNAGSVDLNSVFVPYSSGALQTATIYPRLIFGTKDATEESLLSGAADSELLRAEGIYVIAVRDDDTTTVVDENGNEQSSASAFYDFYIRSCWYGSDANEPSAISTVIRLYDPDAVNAMQVGWVRVNFNSNYAGGPSLASMYGRKVTVPNVSRSKYTFKGWCDGSVTKTADGDDTCSGKLYPANSSVTGSTVGQTEIHNLTAVWERIKYTVTYSTTGGSAISQKTICYEDTSSSCTITSTKPTRSDFRFNKWCLIYPISNATTCSGTSYASGASIPLSVFPASRQITLYATWDLNTKHTISYNTTEGSAVSQTACYQTSSGGSCTISGTKPTRPGYTFSKWCLTYPSDYATSCSGTSYSSGSTIPYSSFPSSHAITLYAVWDRRYIQDYSAATCQSEASGAEQTLIDKRDKSPYTVRYANGRCWMTSDLHIGAYTSSNVTAANSNFSSPSTWNLNVANTYTQASATLYSNRGYYNFCAVTAGTGNGCTKSTPYSGSNDICPANWRLPNGSEAQAVMNNRNVFSLSNTYDGQYWWTTSGLPTGWTAISDGSMLQYVIRRSGNTLVFNPDYGWGSNGANYGGYFRTNTFPARCVHK